MKSIRNFLVVAFLSFFSVAVIASVNNDLPSFPDNEETIVVDAEQEPELENWMSDANYWLTTDFENELKLEIWMSDFSYWTADYCTTENELELENWMSDTSYWTE